MSNKNVRVIGLIECPPLKLKIELACECGLKYHVVINKKPAYSMWDLLAVVDAVNKLIRPEHVCLEKAVDG